MLDTDWSLIEKWDNKYILRTFSTQDEYEMVPVESTDGD